MSVQQAFFTTDEHEIYIDKYDDGYIVEVYTADRSKLVDKAHIGTYHSAYLYVNKKYLQEVDNGD